MTDVDLRDRPWDRLRDLADTGDSRGLEALLSDFSASDAVRALLRLAPEDQERLLTTLTPSIGGTVPLILKRFGVDPAVASGPILTTVTDMFGFFLVLSFAAAMLPLLTES